MNNKEFDEMRFGYIYAINELTNAMTIEDVSIKITDKVSIDAEIPSDYIKNIAEMAVASFNYGCEEFVNEGYDEMKDYSIHYSDIDILKEGEEDVE